MAISDNYVPLRQPGNGVTTAFSSNWNMIAAAYALVYLEDAVSGVQTAVPPGPGAGQYTLVFNAGGFTVTYGTAPPIGQYAVVGRNVAQDQTNPYRTAKGFQGDVLESSLDKITAMVQDLSDAVSRSLTFPLGSTASGSLPSPVGNGGRVVAINATENGLVYLAPNTNAYLNVSPYMVTVLPAANAAAARTLLAAAGSGANADITSLAAILHNFYDSAVVNGNMNVWKHGISFTPAGGAVTYTADQWAAFRTVTGYTVSQVATGGLAGLPRFSLKQQRTAGDASAQTIRVCQSVETQNCLIYAGKQVTLSWFAYAGTNYSPSAGGTTMIIRTGTGTDQNIIAGYTGETNFDANFSVVQNGNPVRFSSTFTVPVNANELGYGPSFLPVGTAGAQDWLATTGYQIDLGPVALPLRDKGIAADEAICARYFYAIGDAVGAGWGGAATSTTAAGWVIPFPVQMRTVPTFSVSTPANFTAYDYAVVGVTAVVSMALGSATKNGAIITTSGAAALTANKPYTLVCNTALAGNAKFSAEL